MYLGRIVGTLAALAMGILVIAMVQCSTEKNGISSLDELENFSTDSQKDSMVPACDPDGAPCPRDLFICTDDNVDGKICTSTNPFPNNGDWVCTESGHMIVCTGTTSEPIDDGGNWVCVEIEDDNDDETTYRCRSHSWYPDGTGNEIEWVCEYDEFGKRNCTVSDGTTNGDDDDDDTVGDDDDDDDTVGDDDDDDDDTNTDTDCICSVLDAERYCDTPEFCLWGKQKCIVMQIVDPTSPTGTKDALDANGQPILTWGDCEETTDIPSECVGLATWYSPQAALCCINNDYCCQDMWDSDLDGDTYESRGSCENIACVQE